MENGLQIVEEGPYINIYTNGIKATFKKIANWKTLGLMAYVDVGLKNSPPNTTDLLLK